MDYRDLGLRIRAIRREKHLTQEELAGKVNISASFLGHIERGTRVASLETLVALCNALDVMPQYLLSASLHLSSEAQPRDLSSNERYRLGEILRMAEDVVHNWNDG